MRCEYITALVVILLLGAGFVFSLNLLSSDDSAHQLQGHLQQLRFAINSLKQETAASAKPQQFGAETTQALVKRVDELAVSHGLPTAAPEPTPAAVVAVPAAAAPAQEAVVATPATPVAASGNNRVLCIMMAGPVKPQEVRALSCCHALSGWMVSAGRILLDSNRYVRGALRRTPHILYRQVPEE